MYRKHAQFILLAFVLVFTISCRGNALPSYWIQSGIIVDGSPSDWNDLPRLWLEDVELSAGIANNADTLYLLVQTNDIRTLFAGPGNGVMFWIDTTCRETQNLGIQFQPDIQELSMMRGGSGMGGGPGGGRGMPPGGSNMAPPGGNGMMPPGGNSAGWNNGQQMTPPDSSRMRRNQPPGNSIRIIQPGNNPIPIIPQDGSYGPKAAYECINGVYCIELAIPIHTLQENGWSVPCESGQDLMLGVETAKMPSSGRRGGGRGGGMHPGGGMGGGRGGGMGSGPPGGGPSGDRQGPGGMLALETEVSWLTISLAQRP